MPRLVLGLLLLAGFALKAAPVAAAHGGPDLLDVVIISLDEATQQRLPGACYVIEGASLEGCDENGDGQVDFRGVVPGTYPFVETRAPAGYQTNPERLIAIEGPPSPVTYAIFHSPLPSSAPSAGAFVAIASLDAATGRRLAGACYVIVGGSLEGCDENGDGQVDFRGVVPGTYEVVQTVAPAGYRPSAGFDLVVAAGQPTAVEVQLLRLGGALR